LCRYLAAAKRADAGAGVDAADADDSNENADENADDERQQQQLEEARGFDSCLPTFVLLSHLFWLAWAVAQAHHSASDFDYLEYAVARRRGFDYHSDKFKLSALSATPAV
jgi:hypothetical protein